MGPEGWTRVIGRKSGVRDPEHEKRKSNSPPGGFLIKGGCAKEWDQAREDKNNHLGGEREEMEGGKKGFSNSNLEEKRKGGGEKGEGAWGWKGSTKDAERIPKAGHII